MLLQVGLDFLGTKMIVDNYKQTGKMERAKDISKKELNAGPSLNHHLIVVGGGFCGWMNLGMRLSGAALIGPPMANRS